MDFLGVGPLEIIFILIIALIVLGPRDMAKTGRTIGRFLRNIVTSPTWKAVQQTSRDIRYLPNKLMREAGLEDQAEELKKLGKDVGELGKFKSSMNQDLKKASSDINQSLSAWTTPPTIDSPHPPTTNASTGDSIPAPMPTVIPENPPETTSVEQSDTSTSETQSPT